MKTKYYPILQAAAAKSRGQQSNAIRRNWSALALGGSIPRRLFALRLPGLLFISTCALLPSPAQAQCKRWDVSGQWELRSDQIVVQVNLRQGNWQQQSANLTGTGTNQLGPKSTGQYTNTEEDRKGVISGNITDNAFTMALAVDNARGDHYIDRYTGTIGPDGKIEGTDKNGKHWVGSRKMKCADLNTPTAKTPYISASGQSQGVTTLTWDGGPDHPYAEVWVKVDDQDEKFVVEKGKGTRQVAVESGKTYLYILSDSGERLATVTVR